MLILESFSGSVWSRSMAPAAFLLADRGQGGRTPGMSFAKMGLPAFVFAALLLPCAFAQTPGSGANSEKLTGHVAKQKKKALAGDTKAHVQLGIAFERGQGVEKNA